jgi:hypothetical protein
LSQSLDSDRVKRPRVESTVHDDFNLTASFVDTDLNITLLTHSQFQSNFCTLRDMRPNYIVSYDADVHIIRRIESYQSTVDEQINVYFLVYGEFSVIVVHDS